jgi:hypothetical protein
VVPSQADSAVAKRQYCEMSTCRIAEVVRTFSHALGFLSLTDFRPAFRHWHYIQIGRTKLGWRVNRYSRNIPSSEYNIKFKYNCLIWPRLLHRIQESNNFFPYTSLKAKNKLLCRISPSVTPFLDLLSFDLHFNGFTRFGHLSHGRRISYLYISRILLALLVFLYLLYVWSVLLIIHRVSHLESRG